MIKEKYQLVWKASGQLDAEMIKVFLESYNIEVLMFEESAGRTYGFTNTPLGEVEIYVKNEQKEDALKVLDSYEKGELNESG
ncbi:MAG TPA: DUF2007 domain-containing protein [Anaerolineae bacterium]|nr:DUF2007 domain-containing protein [Anaerolineae bacterium]